MRKFDNCVDAYDWFINHPKLQFDFFGPWIELTPVLVNPETKEIDEDDFKNTEVNWWIEAGPYKRTSYGFFDPEDNIIRYHDTHLDCGGETADEAIMELVKLTFEEYGDYDEEN